MLSKKYVALITLMILVVVGSVVIVIMLNNSSAKADDNHCIQFLRPIESGSNASTPMTPLTCFDTLAEAADYITNGTVQLPSDATADEYMAAIDAYLQQQQETTE